MKRIDEWVNEAYPDELVWVKPEPVNEGDIRAKTLEKLGIAAEAAKAPRPLRKRRKGLRAVLAGAGAAAACIAALLTVNAAAPAFAEGLPGVGELFRAINHHNSGDFYNAENLSDIEERMVPVTDAVSTTQEGDMKFSVKEAFYDGMSLYCAAELETELDPNAENTDWQYEIYIDGKKLDFDYRNFGRKWIKTEENTYASDAMSTKIPAEFRPEVPGDVRVKVEAVFWDMSRREPYTDLDGEKANKILSEKLGAATAEFTAKYDPSRTVEVTGDAEQNGVKFVSLVSTPASTSVTVDVPREMAGYYGDKSSSVGLYLENGGKVELNAGETRGSARSPLYWQETQSGEGIPEGETRVIVKVEVFDSATPFSWKGETVAEFIVDLEEKTITPKE